MKLITEEKFKFGQKNIIPFVGEVQISEKGVIEIENKETALKIVDLNIGFSLLEENQTTTTTELIEKIENDELNRENIENDYLSQDQIKKTLNEHNLAELKDIAKDSSYSYSEWGKLNKNELIDYLTNKAIEGQNLKK